MSREFTPLGTDELPGEGDLVGLDAEFVTLNQVRREVHDSSTKCSVSYFFLGRRLARFGMYGPLPLALESVMNKVEPR